MPVDQPGVSADSAHRQGCRGARGDTVTGPSFQTVPKTTQSVGKGMEVPLIRQARQVTSYVESPQTQHIDKGVEVPAVTQRQVPSFTGVSSSVGPSKATSPRPSAHGPQPSSVVEPDAAVLSIIMLMPETRALWDSISAMRDSGEKDPLQKQHCGFAQKRLAMVQASAADG